MRLAFAILLLVIADVLAYIQMYFPTMWNLSKLQKLFLLMLGIPISYLFMVGTKFTMQSLETQWASRIMFLLLGNFVFLLCAMFIAGEQLTIKNGVVLGLTVLLLLIQIVWK